MGAGDITNLIIACLEVENLADGLYLVSRTPTRPTMPARSIASATISFGLVSVPVNLYSSAESKTPVSFNMLHKKCNTRLKQQYPGPQDNEIVTRDDPVKGYES